MDLSINFSNISFNARMPKQRRIELDKTLSAMLEDNKVDLAYILEKSGYKKNAIFGWFNDKFGMSPIQYFKKRQKENFANALVELYNQGLTVYQLAEHYSCSLKKMYIQLKKQGLDPAENLNAKFDKEVMDMIYKGYNVKEISKRLNCPLLKVKTWIKNNLGESIVKYRKKNGIRLNPENTQKAKNDKIMIKKCFSEGKGLKETAKLMGVSKTKVVYLKDKYDMQTTMDRGHELMEQFLPDMVQAGDSLLTMSRFFGLSKSTVSRRIIALYGKSYQELIKGK